MSHDTIKVVAVGLLVMQCGLIGFAAMRISEGGSVFYWVMIAALNIAFGAVNVRTIAK